MFQALLLQLQNLGEGYVLSLANNLFIQQGFELRQVSYPCLLTAVALTSSFPVNASIPLAPLMCILEHLMCSLELYLLGLVGEREDCQLSSLLFKKRHTLWLSMAIQKKNFKKMQKSRSLFAFGICLHSARGVTTAKNGLFKLSVGYLLLGLQVAQLGQQ